VRREGLLLTADDFLELARELLDPVLIGAEDKLPAAVRVVVEQQEPLEPLSEFF